MTSIPVRVARVATRESAVRRCPYGNSACSGLTVCQGDRELPFELRAATGTLGSLHEVRPQP
ncbi:hypothetical protein ACWGB8_31755 [Kitasatospora sp. NPDC054939]